MQKNLLLFLLVFACLLNACVEDGQVPRQARGAKSKVSAMPKSLQKRYRVNVFIENSVSMDGYVNNVTSFQQAIYALVADIQSSKRVSEVNFYYANNLPIPGLLKADVTKAEVFVNHLNPDTFRKNGRSRGSSDLKKNLELALQKVDTNSVSLFISDCIFSPGLKQDAGKYLKTQETGLKSSFKAKLDSVSFSTKVLQYEGLFNGIYFDQEDKPGKITYKKRPFYMIAMGPSVLLSELLNENNLEQYKTRGYKADLIISPSENQNIPAKMTYKFKSGQFTIQAPASKLIINEAMLQGNKPFRFAVAADLRDLTGATKKMETFTRYELTEDFKLDSIIAIKDTSEKSLKGMSHLFLFSAASLKQKQDVTFKLFRRTPDWVALTSIDDDRDLVKQARFDRTFGLSYLISGISSAYTMAFQNQELMHLQMQVDTNEGGMDEESGGFNWAILLIPVVLVLVIIIVKNKK